MPRSIRWRILLGVVLCVGLLNALLSIKGYVDARHETEELFDARLAQSARLLSGLLHEQLDAKALRRLQQALQTAPHAASTDEEQEPEALVTGHHYETKLAFWWLDSQGQVRLKSHNAPAALPLTPGYAVTESTGRRWRSFSLATAAGGWVVVAERDDVRGELAQKIAARNLLPDALGLPLIALLVGWLVTWGLRPLAQLIAAIARRHPQDLTALPLPHDAPQEIVPLTQAINSLLAQLQAQRCRESRFIADAAHELRTPLAVLAVHAENAQQATTAEERMQSLTALQRGVARATRLASQLLALARLEGEASVAPCDLASLARHVSAELIPLALQRGQSVSLDCPEHVPLQGAQEDLELLLQNLLANALSYSPEQGQIELRLALQPTEVVLTVDDSGPGIAPAQRQSMFERFMRGEQGQGAGLGLAIAQRAVERHGGQIRLTDSPLGGLRVWVSLPRQ